MALRIRKNTAVIPASCMFDWCMGLLRGAWSPHVIWFLSAGPRRFGELRVDMPGISARVLSARLRELEANGVIARSATKASIEYSLTDLGRQLVPVLDSIVRVGRKLRLGPDAPVPQK